MAAPFSAKLLSLDYAAEADRVGKALQEQVLRRFRKKGIVVGLSGGIDSSVVAGLSVRALGPERVLGLLMPEKDSSADTLSLSRSLAEHLQIEAVYVDLTNILEAVGCYRERDAAIKKTIPEYGPGWKSKIVLPSVLDTEQFRTFSVIAQSPKGETKKERLELEPYLQIVAATNFKQRVRKMLEYFHADRLNYAVAGTPNRVEYDQGFFVKLGDGAADVKPIAHLYKTQVYAMARFLKLPEVICSRPPTTDTYSLSQSQEEFFFSVSHDKLDLILFGKNDGYSAADVAREVGLTEQQVERVMKDIDAKRRMATYLHAAPALVEEI
jgi:NAD+ synthase